MKKIISFILVLTLVFILTATLAFTTACNEKSDNPYKTEYTNADNPVVTINLNDGSAIKVELYPAVAPIAVKRFLDCCNDGFYNNKIFHRIIEGFVVQGGGMYMDGNNMIQSSTAAYPDIKGEFTANGVQNNLKHAFGVLAFARLGDYPSYNLYNYDSATVQFYFCLDDLPSLDGNYTTFGRIIDEQSAEVLNRLGKVVTTTVSGNSDVPVTPIVIRNTRIEWNKYKQLYV